MSRLTDLLDRAGELDPELAKELLKEFRARTSRRFGLVFEAHVPEWTALPTRRPARGDTVKFDSDAGQYLWTVKRLDRRAGTAVLDPLAGEPGSDERQQVEVEIRELTVLSKFGQDLFPGLRQDGFVRNADPDVPAHAVITAENEHALRLLQYTHKGALDCIYLDPPYNSGARDWKYSNDYVGLDDEYRHSKWLAFMERRLKLAKSLLNPDDSVLIVTIDEKEYLRLGMLLEQVFPEARIQMVSSVINPMGSGRSGDFSRVDEYIYIAMLGEMRVPKSGDNMLVETKGAASGAEVRWTPLNRDGSNWERSGRPNSFFPLYIDPLTLRVLGYGPAPALGTDIADVDHPEGDYYVAWPMKGGEEARWQISGESMMELQDSGFLRTVALEPDRATARLRYLTAGIRAKVDTGELLVSEVREDGSKVVVHSGGHSVQPRSVWNKPSHSARDHGSALIRTLMPDRKFPYPKSLYAVEDVLRFFVADKPGATILDFFAGSGTTAHAVMRLNEEDGGRRRSISVTNNEVGPDEATILRKAGHRPGDPEWEARGICDYITKPRLTAAITGVTSTGEAIKGSYRYNREAEMADGLVANIEFFTLSYEGGAAIREHERFKAVAPVMWLRAGQQGPILDSLGDQGWSVSQHYGVIQNLDSLGEFAEQVADLGTPLVFVITDDAAEFTAASASMPGVQTQQLYADYLSNVKINEKD